MNQEKNLFERLIGQPVKLVVQEPGQEKPRTYYGKIEDINDTLILFKSSQGYGSFGLQYVIAVKPQKEVDQ